MDGNTELEEDGEDLVARFIKSDPMRLAQFLTKIPRAAPPSTSSGQALRKGALGFPPLEKEG